MNSNAESSNLDLALMALLVLCLVTMGTIALFVCAVCLQVQYTGKQLVRAWKRYFRLSFGVLTLFYIYGAYLFASWIMKGLPKLGITPNANLVDRIVFWAPILLGLASLLVTCWVAYLAFTNYLLKPLKKYFLMVAGLRQQARQNLINAFRDKAS